VTLTPISTRIDLSLRSQFHPALSSSTSTAVTAALYKRPTEFSEALEELWTVLPCSVVLVKLIVSVFPVSCPYAHPRTDFRPFAGFS
jgi:hypothetical protein